MQRLISHEMGHAFGLVEHSARCVDVMATDIAPIDLRISLDLREGEVDGVEYPEAQVTPGSVASEWP